VKRPLRKVVFDRISRGASDQPTLSVRESCRQRRAYILLLRYIATGMKMVGGLCAAVNPDGAHLYLSGWITCNISETGFSQAFLGP